MKWPLFFLRTHLFCAEQTIGESDRMTLKFLEVEKRLTLGASSAKPVRIRVSISE